MFQIQSLKLTCDTLQCNHTVCTPVLMTSISHGPILTSECLKQSAVTIDSQCKRSF